jgi:hypothetical protein
VKETVAYCDLDDKEARRPGVAVLKFEIDGVTHVADVCSVHLTLLGRLPSGAVRGRRRGVRRVAKRVAKKAPAKRVGRPAKAAAPAKAVKKVAAKKVAAKKVPARKAAAKKAPSKRAAKSTAGRVSGSRRDQQQQIAAARTWARAQGRSISDKGRLPAGLLEEFASATS